MSINNLVIKNLKAKVNKKEILKGIDLNIKPGKVIALMGPNGSGKSTLAQVLMGKDDYNFSGSAKWQEKEILKLNVSDRARMGLFLSFQHPYEIPGVNVYEFLATSFKAVHGEEKFNKVFKINLEKAMESLGLSEAILERNINEGFSGGEKKKFEILQLIVLEPKIAILDETDSGLDIDALKLISENVNKLKTKKIGFLVITHYQRLLNFLKPDEVHVMLDGKIVKSGDKKLVSELEKKGYGWLKK